MNKYENILQISVILFILLLIYLFIRYIKYQIKNARIKDFTITSKKEENNELLDIYNIIYTISSFLKSLVVFNTISKKYDKYIEEDSKIKEGIDYISIKLIISFILIMLYSLQTILYKQSLNSIIILIILIISFIIPNIYLYFKNKNKTTIIESDILKVIIIMNNSFKANRNIEQAIKDSINRTEGPIKEELKKINNDIKLGLSIGESFRRMYLRTKLPIIKKISNILSLINISGANIVIIFESLEKEMIEEQKINNEIREIRKTNILAYFIFMLLPLIFILVTITFNPLYIKLFEHKYSIILLIVLITIYSIYLYLIRILARGKQQ